MEPDADEVVFDAPGYFCMYKSGKIVRVSQPLAAAGVDDTSGVSSKDIVLDADTGLSVRLFLPRRQGPSGKKLPVLVYFHGGGFLIGSAKFATYHNYLTSLASAAGVLAVSVDYRLAPEHQLPAAYDDCWAALQWAASAQDDWIAEHGDAGRVFVAGDSAGGNIVHNVLMKASTGGSSADNGGGAPRIEGAVFLHAFFGGRTLIDGEPERAVAIAEKVWTFACRDAADGADDPWINPTAPGAPSLERLGCQRVLVCAAEKDWLAARDRAYYAALVDSAWPGSAEWLESSGEEHVFFVTKPECENAKQLMDRVAAFIAGA
ncbi:hypothetical protein BDA96_02G238600 [Sorghum bicolor]|uniref:Alpha/beta hydrolase fold-3 domain-containing protein n=2 Tax=Sorghum bicolor TaxID=4558 RepID=A0A921RRY5_SORBI|nr:tuliposide A-converting enzyme b1, amyloplastic [Sorghum bicolor]KAG0544012.1 hypothetical protein BDA96_02G238600 [Sorghum bicolor]OQU89622.1 hypothetical protein SORBI_3002G227800 [Sorghum bicolor]|eukprot:XP_021309513.1 tuliposide A-converting enzyme b1, amyloplastic [Sorghum bicolor]